MLEGMGLAKWQTVTVRDSGKSAWERLTMAIMKPQPKVIKEIPLKRQLEARPGRKVWNPFDPYNHDEGLTRQSSASTKKKRNRGETGQWGTTAIYTLATETKISHPSRHGFERGFWTFTISSVTYRT